MLLFSGRIFLFLVLSAVTLWGGEGGQCMRDGVLIGVDNYMVTW